MRLGWPRLLVDLIQTCYDRRWVGGETPGCVRQKTGQGQSSTISQGRSFPGVVEVPPVCRGEEGNLLVRAAGKEQRRRGGAQIRYGQTVPSWAMAGWE